MAVNVPWALVTGGDSSYPEANWKQPLSARLTGRYFTMVQRAAVNDGAVFAMFIKVQNLVESPSAFFHPAFVLRREPNSLACCSMPLSPPPNDALAELAAVLGTDNVRALVRTFLREFPASFEQLRGGERLARLARDALIRPARTAFLGPATPTHDAALAARHESVRRIPE